VCDFDQFSARECGRLSASATCVKSCFFLLVLVALVGTTSNGSLIAQTQSLADVARKSAQERRTEPAKVYTSADLKPCEAEAPPTAPPLRGSDDQPVKLLIGEPTREEIVRAITPAVVTIETSNSTGTGFFVASGLVLTSKHVVALVAEMKVAV